MILEGKINAVWTVKVNNVDAMHYTTRTEARAYKRRLKANGATGVTITQRKLGTPTVRR